jgi:hypothetical protein
LVWQDEMNIDLPSQWKHYFCMVSRSIHLKSEGRKFEWQNHSTWLFQTSLIIHRSQFLNEDPESPPITLSNSKPPDPAGFYRSKCWVTTRCRTWIGMISSHWRRTEAFDSVGMVWVVTGGEERWEWHRSCAPGDWYEMNLLFVQCNFTTLLFP